MTLPSNENKLPSIHSNDRNHEDGNKAKSKPKTEKEQPIKSFFDKFLSTQNQQRTFQDTHLQTMDVLQREDKNIELKLLTRRIASNTDTIIDILKDMVDDNRNQNKSGGSLLGGLLDGLLDGFGDKNKSRKRRQRSKFNPKSMLPFLGAGIGFIDPEDTKFATTGVKAVNTASTLAKDAGYITDASKLAKVTKITNSPTMNKVARGASIGAIGGRLYEGDNVGAGMEATSLALHEASSKVPTKLKPFTMGASLLTDGAIIARDFFTGKHSSDKSEQKQESIVSPQTNSTTMGQTASLVGGGLIAGGAVKGLKSATSAIKNNFQSVPTSLVETVSSVAKAPKTTSIASDVLKGGAKIGGKAIPLVGAGLSAISAYDRGKDGDYVGAGLEIVSGLASFIPIVGTATSVAIQGGLLARDLYKATHKATDEIAESTKQANKNVIATNQTMTDFSKSVGSFQEQITNMDSNKSADFINGTLQNIGNNIGIVNNTANPFANNAMPSVYRKGSYVSKTGQNHNYDDAMQSAYNKNGIDKNLQGLLKAQVATESNFNPNAKSGVGAFGLTQFMPSTAKAYGVKAGDTKDAVDSQLNGQAKYMKYLMNRYKGRSNQTELALMAYNWGEGNVDKYLKGQKKYVPVETREYVNKVMGNADKYNKDFGVTNSTDTIPSLNPANPKGNGALSPSTTGTTAGTSTGSVGASTESKDNSVANNNNKNTKDADYDLDKICATAVKRAGKKSQGRCAEYVRIALQSGDNKGKIKGGLGDAKNWISSLPKVGWTTASGGTQKGDIAVFPQTSSKYGHVCIFTGSVWVSDFVQNQMQPNSRASYPHTIFRANNGSSSGGAVTASPSEDGTDTKKDGTKNGTGSTDGSTSTDSSTSSGGIVGSALSSAGDLVKEKISGLASAIGSSSEIKGILDSVNNSKIDSYKANPLNQSKIDNTGFDIELKEQTDGKKYKYGEGGKVDEKKLFNPSIVRQSNFDQNQLQNSGKMNNTRQLNFDKNQLQNAGIMTNKRQLDFDQNQLQNSGSTGGIVRQRGTSMSTSFGKFGRMYGKKLGGKYGNLIGDVANLFGYGDLYNTADGAYQAKENGTLLDYGLRKSADYIGGDIGNAINIGADANNLYKNKGSINQWGDFTSNVGKKTGLFNKFGISDNTVDLVNGGIHAQQNDGIIGLADYGVRMVDSKIKENQLKPDYMATSTVDTHINNANKEYENRSNSPIVIPSPQQPQIQQPQIQQSGGNINGLSSDIITRNPDSIFRLVAMTNMKVTTS